MVTKMQQFTVGKLAKKANINIETLRYYENIGLMPKPKKLESGYRVYAESDLRKLLFIKNSKMLGFTLKEIKELLFLKVDDDKNCNDVRTIAENKINEIDIKLKEMRKIKKALSKLADKCKRKTDDECPILSEIESLI